jgi:hypothetical protein
MSKPDRSQSALYPLRDEDGRSIVSRALIRRSRVIAEAVFATEGGPPPPERLDWLALDLEDYFARSGVLTRFIFGLAVLGVWVLAPLVVLRLTSLARMPLGERTFALTSLESGRFAGPLLAVKALLCVIYYEHPDAAEAIGFDGLSLIEARARGLAP